MKNINQTSLLSFFTKEILEEAFEKQLLIQKTYLKNTLIHIEGDTCNKVELILSGKIDATRIDEKGNSFKVNAFKENDVIGATLIYASNPIYPMTLSSQSDVQIIEVSQSFIDLGLEQKAFRHYYLQLISNQAQLLGIKIKHHMHQSIRDNVMLFLVNETKKQNRKTIELSMSKKQLAENLGIQRTSLSRELKKMEDEGIIEVNKKRITLL